MIKWLINKVCCTRVRQNKFCLIKKKYNLHITAHTKIKAVHRKKKQFISYLKDSGASNNGGTHVLEMAEGIGNLFLFYILFHFSSCKFVTRK